MNFQLLTEFNLELPANDLERLILNWEANILKESTSHWLVIHSKYLKFIYVQFMKAIYSIYDSRSIFISSYQWLAKQGLWSMQYMETLPGTRIPLATT